MYCWLPETIEWTIENIEDYTNSNMLSDQGMFDSDQVVPCRQTESIKT